jgi:predicted RNA polymerase sigma factor
MAQRISRAKQSIKASGVPFRMPTSDERAERLRAVLHVIYLIFNEGYTSSAGPHLRAARAIRRGHPAGAHVHALAGRKIPRWRGCWR